MDKETLNKLLGAAVVVAAIGSPIAAADVTLVRTKRPLISHRWWAAPLWFTTFVWTTLTAHMQFRCKWSLAMRIGAFGAFGFELVVRALKSIAGIEINIP